MRFGWTHYGCVIVGLGEFGDDGDLLGFGIIFFWGGRKLAGLVGGDGKTALSHDIPDDAPTLEAISDRKTSNIIVR